VTGVNGPGVPDDPRPAAGTPDAGNEPYAFPRPAAPEADGQGFPAGSDEPRAGERPRGWVPFAPPGQAVPPGSPEQAGPPGQAGPSDPSVPAAGVPPRPREAPPAPAVEPSPAAVPEPVPEELVPDSAHEPEPRVPVGDFAVPDDPGRQVCEALRLDLGAYVLGALDETETHWIRSHVATCPECRAEYDQLAVLPQFLARLTPSEAEASGVAQETRPESLFPAAAERVRRDRRQRTTVLAAAAAFAVLVGTFGWVMGTQDDTTSSARSAATATPSASPAESPAPPPPPADQRTATAADARSGAEMSLVYRAVAWGTAIDLQLAGVPGGTRCQLDVYGTKGRQETASSWVVPKEGYQKPGSMHVPGGTSIPPDEITRFVVSTVGDEDELLVAKTGENQTKTP